MEPRNFLWSATSCEYPGAGLYFGLAVHFEHQALARYLSSKQTRILLGGTFRLHPEGPQFPLNYFAVRDPSAVKVVPILDEKSGPGDVRHFKLSFRLSRPDANPHGEAIARAMDEHARRCAEASPDIIGTAAFVLTIGLPIAREEAFHSDLVGNHTGQTWSDLHHRLVDHCKIQKNKPAGPPRDPA